VSRSDFSCCPSAIAQPRPATSPQARADIVRWQSWHLQHWSRGTTTLIFENLVKQIKAANSHMRKGTNTCGKPLLKTPVGHYLGRTRAHPDISTTPSSVSCGRFNTTNVVAKLTGSDAKLRDQAILYSAHHDHLGIGPADKSGDTIYNGALDNACARVLRRSWTGARADRGQRRPAVEPELAVTAGGRRFSASTRAADGDPSALHPPAR